MKTNVGRIRTGVQRFEAVSRRESVISRPGTAFIAGKRKAIAQITAGRFALSDPLDDDFKHQCLHAHTTKCDSCEELKIVLRSIEEKINELSSSMYNKDQHDDLLYDFNKSADSITQWKCHILRSENQEIGKQSFIQDLTEDSAYSCRLGHEVFTATIP